MNVTAWLKRAEKAISVDVDNLRSIKLLIHDNYAVFSQTVSPTQLQMMAEDLLEFGVPEVEMAMTQWRKEGPPGDQKPRPPMPSDLIRIMRPKVDPSAEANAIAATILACISKFGLPNHVSAREYMGELAWATVEMRGGWPNLCRSTREDSLNTTHAQLRDTARAAMSRQGVQVFEGRRVATRETLRFAKAEVRPLKSITEVLAEVAHQVDHP